MCFVTMLRHLFPMIPAISRCALRRARQVVDALEEGNLGALGDSLARVGTLSLTISTLVRMVNQTAVLVVELEPTSPRGGNLLETGEVGESSFAIGLLRKGTCGWCEKWEEMGWGMCLCIRFKKRIRNVFVILLSYKAISLHCGCL